MIVTAKKIVDFILPEQLQENDYFIFDDGRYHPVYQVISPSKKENFDDMKFLCGKDMDTGDIEEWGWVNPNYAPKVLKVTI